VAAKVYLWSPGPPAQYWFHCPGCKNDHAFTIGTGDQGWTFNGDLEKPTFRPSLLCNKDNPKRRCHSFVTAGKIEFLKDCHHELRSQTVDLPDYEGKLWFGN